MNIKAAATSADGLKLRAEDGEDLALISGLLQDALISGADMTFDNVGQRFVAVFNRFCWERDGALSDKDSSNTGGQDPQPGAYHRTHSGLVLDNIAGVKSKNIDLCDSGTLLNLLSIHANDEHLEFLFSGGAALRLSCQKMQLHLSDLGEPWPTKWRPHHGHDTEILAEEMAREGKAREQGAQKSESTSP